MPEMINPYIVGAPITEPRMFFGRSDVFDWISSNLTGQFADHILVIHGQRRIGKTSVLKQLPAHLPEQYVPVFIDLQGRTHTSLDRFLWWLAREIVRTLRQDRGILLDLPARDAFVDDTEAFDNGFLTTVEAALGGCTLLLAFDEFDALEQPQAQYELASPLIDYLVRLMGRPHLGFIYSIGSSGRKLENMQASYTSFFKAALYKRISFLGREETLRLIRQPVDGVLDYDAPAAQLIYRLTSGHPYFTQLICHELFLHCQQMKAARVDETNGLRRLAQMLALLSKRNVTKVHEEQVQAVLDIAVELGTSNLKFYWDDASSLEKWILTGVAQHSGRVDGAGLATFLRQQHVRYVRDSLESALLHFREKDVLTGDNEFVVSLLRTWLLKNRPLERVREELTEANPIANRYIEIGQAYRDEGLHNKALASFREALAVDPDNIQAQVSIGAVYVEDGDYESAVREFETALRMDEDDVGARTGMSDACLALGDQLRARDRPEEALAVYNHVLSLNPEHLDARQRVAEIYQRRATSALRTGQLDEARVALQAALALAPDNPAMIRLLEQLRPPSPIPSMGPSSDMTGTAGGVPSTRGQPGMVGRQRRADYRLIGGALATILVVGLIWTLTLSKVSERAMPSATITYRTVVVIPSNTSTAVRATPSAPIVFPTAGMAATPASTPASAPASRPSMTPSPTPSRAPTTRPTNPAGIGQVTLLSPNDNQTDVTGKPLTFSWQAPAGGITGSYAYQVILSYRRQGQDRTEVLATTASTSVTADVSTLQAKQADLDQYQWYVCVVDMRQSPNTQCLSGTTSPRWNFLWRRQ